MATFGIEFAVTCETSFGEKACICGNLPALGQWNPTQGVILVTEKNSYPVWTTPTSLRIRYRVCEVEMISRSSLSYA